jgi:hypothetical protein
MAHFPIPFLLSLPSKHAKGVPTKNTLHIAVYEHALEIIRTVLASYVSTIIAHFETNL